MAAPELYIVVEVSAHAAPVLEAALKAAPVSSLLLKAPVGAKLEAHTLKPLVELAQKKGIAALVADDWDLARIVRADGVHLSWAKDQLQRYEAARAALGTRYIVGADAGRSRDDAMSLGESGADYIGFGIPAHVEDRDTAFSRQQELLSWWSEIFEVPCVAFDAPTPEAATDLAAAHADFVAVMLPAGLSAQEGANRLSDFAAAVSAAPVET